MTSEALTPSMRENKSLVYWLGDIPSRALVFLACIFLFVMMTGTFIDVAGRYLFNSPLPASAELTAFIMPAMIFCALPLVCFREENVTIDLLDAFVPSGAKRMQGFIVSLISAATMAFMSWRLYAKFSSHFEYEEVTDELFMSLWPFSLGISILAAIATLALLANAFGYAMNLKTHPS
jgi:TRAP-type C4-dicarboxylate transport system permease small subunit